jgi:ABC-type oligopeptide transport system substrate-binding subunit
MTDRYTDTPFSASLPFFGKSGHTYLIGIYVSDDLNGNLQVDVNQVECPVGSLCMTVQSGNGGSAWSPNTIVTNGSGEYVTESQGGMGGYVEITGLESGTYSLFTSAWENFILTNNVVVDSSKANYLSVSAVGLPKVTLSMKDKNGTAVGVKDAYIKASDIIKTSVAGSPWFGGRLQDMYLVPPETEHFYITPGVYTITAYSKDVENSLTDGTEYSTGADKMVLSKEGVTISGDQTLVFDASAMPLKTATINLDGISSGTMQLKGDTLNNDQGYDVTNGDTLYFSLPDGTYFTPALVTKLADKSDSTKSWQYQFIGEHQSFTSGTAVYAYGGDLSMTAGLNTAAPYLKNQTLDSQVDVKDAHGNNLNEEMIQPDGTEVAPVITVKDSESNTVSGSWDDTAPKIFSHYLFTIPEDGPFGAWSISATLDLGPYADDDLISSPLNFNVEATTTPGNDPFENPTIIASLPFSTTETTIGATTQADELQSSCSKSDSRSVWFEFSSTSNGIYSLDTNGSDYSPNISVFDKSDNSEIVCHGTNVDDNSQQKLSFYGVSGKTYVISISDASSGGILKLSLYSRDCEDNSICVAFTGANGTFTQNLQGQLYSSEDNGGGWINSTPDGVLVLPLTNPVADPNLLVIKDKSVFLKLSTTDQQFSAGNYAQDARDFPKTEIYTKSADGVQNPGTVTLFDTDLGVTDVLGVPEEGDSVNPLTLYSTPGTFALEALIPSPTTEIITMENVISGGGSITLDASSMLKETYTIHYDNLSSAVNGWIYFNSVDLDNGSYTLPMSDGQTITIAYPQYTNYEPDFGFQMKDDSGTYWSYALMGEENVFSGDSSNHDLYLGGTPIFSLDANSSSYAPGESGELYFSAKDAYQNRFGWVSELENGQDNLPLPSFTVKDSDGNFVSGNLSDNNNGLWTAYNFSVPEDTISGTWTATAEGDFGPLANSANASTSFNVLGCHTLTVNANSSVYGKVIVSTDPNCLGDKYVEGTKVQLNAVANSGYSFAYWSDGATDDPYSITIDSDTTLTATFGNVPGQPTLLLPANNALMEITGIKFDWSDVKPTAKTYELQIATDNAFSNIVVDKTNISSSLYVTTENLQNNTTYYWRVRGSNDGKAIGGWSAYRTIRTLISAPALVSPDVDESVLNLRPKFDWETVSSATGYTLQLSPTVGFTSNITTFTISSNTSEYSPTTDLGSGKTFYWRVRTLAANGPSNWSGIRKFTTPTPPGTPISKTPSFNTLTTTTPTLIWTAPTSSGDSSLDHYELQVINTSDSLRPIVLDESISASSTTQFSITTPLDPATSYLWHIRVFSTSGAYSNWSNDSTFKTRIDTPSLVSPDNSTTSLSLRPTFKWNAITGATGYYIFVGTTKYSVTGNKTEFTPTIDLKSGLAYSWYIQAINSSYGPSLASETRTITMPTPPGVPTLLTPANSAQVNGYTPLLDWSDSTIPAGISLDHYDIQISKISTFGAVDDITGTSSSSNYQVADSLAPNTIYYWRVRSANSTGAYSAWSRVNSFQTKIAPPVLQDPDNSEDSDSLRPTFKWQSVTGAIGYTLQIAKDNNFASLVGSFPTASSVMEYTPTKDLPAGLTLYWRVQAKAASNQSDLTAGEVRSFTTPKVPSIPNLLTPGNGALVTDSTPILDWSDSTGTGISAAASYEIQASTDSTFTLDVLSFSTTSSTYEFTSTLNSNAVYYWRVRSLNAAGEHSAWSTVRTLREAILAPELTSPDADTTVDNLMPTFSWQDVLGATGYTIQIAKDNRFSSVLLTASSTSESYTSKINLPVNTDVYWRVQSKAVNGPSLWSETRKIHIANPPSVPVLLTPATNTLQMDLTPVLDWKDSTIPAGTTFKNYQVQVGLIADFSVCSTYESTDSSIEIPVTLIPNNTYYWRVRSVNTEEQVSQWSASRTFKTAVLAPSLTSPADSEQPQTLRPTFDWESVPGATGYTIQLSSTATFASLIKTANTTTTEYLPTADLPAGITLYWRVKTLAANGPSLWSEVRSVKLPTPLPIPSLVSPINTKIASYHPTLTWKTITIPVGGSAFSGYEAQVSTDKNFNTGLVVNKVVSTSINSVSYTVETALNRNTTYYWRLRSVTSDGSRSAWSSVSSFATTQVMGETLNIRESSAFTDISTLDPQKATSIAESDHLTNIFEGLTRIDKDQNIIPGAASSWSYSSDNLTLTFNLRSGLKYSDGTLLNAVRYRYSILRLLDPRVDNYNRDLLSPIVGANNLLNNAAYSYSDSAIDQYLSEVGVKVYTTNNILCASNAYTQADCLKLVISFTQPFPAFLSMTSSLFFAPAKQEYVDLGEDWWQDQSHLIGNGPFVVKTLSQTDGSIFLPNANYWGDVPDYSIKYIYSGNGDSDDGLSQYQNNQADIIPVTRKNSALISADTTLNSQKLSDPGSCTYMIVFNTNKAPFNNIEVRKAFAMAFDRQTYVNETMGGKGLPTLSWIPFGMAGYDTEESRWNYNNVNALAALEPYRSSLPSEIDLPYNSNGSNNFSFNWIASHLSNELSINVKAIPLTSDQYNNLFNDPKDYPLIRYTGWCGDYPDPSTFMSSIWKTNAFNGITLGYSNSSVDTWIDLGDKEMDIATRLEDYQTAQKALVADVPAIFIANSQNTYLVKPAIKDITPNIMDIAWPGETDPNSIWIQR